MVARKHFSLFFQRCYREEKKLFTILFYNEKKSKKKTLIFSDRKNSVQLQKEQVSVQICYRLRIKILV